MSSRVNKRSGGGYLYLVDQFGGIAISIGYQFKRWNCLHLMGLILSIIVQSLP
jgi:hypothetical protein